MKIGFTSTIKGVKDRIRKAYNFIHPVSEVLGGFDGGASLEALMHHRFEIYADARVETFSPAEPVMSWARQGAGHRLVVVGNRFLNDNKARWSQP